MFGVVANPGKIFVCSAAFGEGHNTAARNLVAALNEVGAGRVDAEFLDILGCRSPKVYEIFRKGYVSLMNRAPRLWSALYRMFDCGSPLDVGVVKILAAERDALAALLKREQPAAVVSTYPLYGYLLDDIARGGGPKDFRRVTVVTDSISINSVWHRCGSDFYCVPNEETAEVMRRAGVPAEKLRVLGFPVDPRFAAKEALPKRADPAGPEGRRVLYMINAGRKAAPETVRLLLEIEDIELTVTVGRDAEMRAMVEHAAAGRDPARRPVNLIGWTKEVPALLASHHLLISKAGGATTQETIAAGCPMIISQIAPGQEEGNAQLLLDNRAGALALTPERIAATVREAFAADAKVCREWTRNIARISRPDAARENARFILEQAGLA